MPREEGRLSLFGSPVSSSPAAPGSPSLLEPSCFQNSWLIADREYFVLPPEPRAWLGQVGSHESRDDRLGLLGAMIMVRAVLGICV